MQKIITKITDSETIEIKKDIECYILPSSLPKDYIQNFAAKACEKILLTDDACTCKEFNLDGIIIDLSKSDNIKKDYALAKKELPKGAIIGAITRNRRHEAMIISEQEPDFIIFRVWKDGAEKVQELVSWYNEFFLIQSAVLPEEEMDCKDFASDIIILNQKNLAK